MDRESLESYIRDKRSKNTRQQTDLSVAKFKKWLANQGKSQEFLQLSARELDTLLGHFILNVKKDDGLEYQPDSITSIVHGVHRYLKEENYPHGNVMESEEFELCRKILESKRKELKEKGMGNKPNKAKCLTVEEENKLWETGQLGIHSPESMLNTVWYFNTKLLGFWGNDENRQLKWGDLQLKTSDDGEEYIEWNERTSKTRQGKVSSHLRAFPPRMYVNSENSDRCPIATYMSCCRRRPAEELAPESDFYLAINYQRRAEDYIWFKRSPLGINMLKVMMKNMATKAGLHGKKTNHSLRKTACTQLLHAGVPPSTIVQLSGHKNIQSLNNYAVASKAQQKAMCSILSKPSSMSGNALPFATGNPPAPLPLPVPDSTPSSTVLPANSALANTNMEISERHNTMLSGMFSGAHMSNFSFVINFNKDVDQDVAVKRPRITESDE